MWKESLVGKIALFYNKRKVCNRFSQGGCIRMGNYLNPGNEKFRRMIQSEIYVDKTGISRS